MLTLESLLEMGRPGGMASILAPHDAHIHVTDTLDASGAFVITHYVMSTLQEKAHNVVWINCRAEGTAHWNSIMRKAVRFFFSSSWLIQGFSLQQFTASGKLQYLEADKFLNDDEPLLSLLDAVRNAISVAQSASDTLNPEPSYLARTLVVFDSLSILQWALPGSIDSVHIALVRLLRSLRALCFETHAALLTLQHADACSVVSPQNPLDDGDENLLRYLLRTADLWIAVNELPSGRAADCDGELTIHGLVRCTAAATAPNSMPDDPFPLQAFRLKRPSQTCLFRIMPDGSGTKNAYGIRSSIKIWPRGGGQGLA